MSLDLQRARLESVGYRIISESRDEIVALRKAHYGRLLFVFVGATGNLSAARVLADSKRVVARARDLDPFRTPRWLRYRFIVMVYVAGAVDPDAQDLLDAGRAAGVRLDSPWYTYAAALDLSSGQAHYLPAALTTPYGGPNRAVSPEWFFPKARRLVQVLIDPPGREPRRWSEISPEPIIILFLVAVLAAALIWVYLVALPQMR